jgi:2',3'-cyclic-nucleotide 2'-phosphodiesterase/3'-nucleotidase
MKMRKLLVSLLAVLTIFGCNIKPDNKVQNISQTRIENRIVNNGKELVVKGEEELEKQVITILATADMHGRIYPYEYATDSVDDDAGYAKAQTLVKKERLANPNLILMDVGDAVQDNSAELFNDLDTHPIVQTMNSMEYDIWAVGNHEFNFEKEFIVRNINNFKGSVISANIYNEEDGTYFVKPYQMFQINGAKVAVVGIVPPYIPMWESSSPSHFKGLKFEDVLASTKKVVEELEGKYDVLIGAYHLGREDDYGGSGIYEVAKAIPEFDVIFGGHEHALYVEDVNGVKILEPGAYGKALAKAEIEIEKVDGKWQKVGVKAETVSSKEVEADKEVLEKMEFVHKESMEDANKVVGKIKDDFIKRVDYITGEDNVTTMPTAQLEANAVIDFINEVQMYYAGAEVSSAALFNFGSNLKAGDFKKKDVAYIYKYTNTLMGVNITGENLLKFMEWSASYYNTWKEGDITVSFNPDVRGYNYDMFSGVNYEINISKEAGSRIENVTINGKAIEPNKVYKLAVNNYRFGTLLKLGLIKESDKYFDSYEKMQDAGRIRDLIVKYTQEVKNGVLAPRVSNNWKITGIKLDYSQREEILNKVKTGEIVIPKSKDGRTLNVKSLNIYEM